MVSFLSAVAATLILQTGAPVDVSKQATKLGLDRVALVKATWAKDKGGSNVSGYLDLYSGHTTILFPFGSGDEVVYCATGTSSLRMVACWQRVKGRIELVGLNKTDTPLPGAAGVPLNWMLADGRVGAAQIPVDFAPKPPFAAYSDVFTGFESWVVRANGTQSAHATTPGISNGKSWSDVGLPISKEEIAFLRHPTKKAPKKGGTPPHKGPAAAPAKASGG